MASPQFACVFKHVRKLIGVNRGVSEATDGELLDRFVSERDESAFEQLVRRHGPMVQRVCRRVLGDAHLAEDAFQAAFLVLARKAAAIRQRRSLAGWLYEVAYHLALRARADGARRRRRELQAHELAQADGSGADPQAQTLLRQELQQLPEKFRTPLVLCYLEGKTNVEAARALGCAAGSMSYRLAQARDLLRDRLAGRGVALAPAACAALLADQAAAAPVSAALVQNSVQAALGFAAGQTSIVGLASGQAVSLAEGMLNAMIATKLKLVAAIVLAVGILGAGTTALVQPAAVAQDAAPAAQGAAGQPSNNPANKNNDAFGDPLPDGALSRLGTVRWRHGSGVQYVGFLADGKQLLTATQNGQFHVWDVATGKVVRRFGQANPTPTAQTGGNVAVALGYAAPNSAAVALAPDGKLLVAAGSDGSVRLWDVATGQAVRQLSVQNQPVRAVGVNAFSVVFAPDGKHVVTRGADQVTRLWDVETGKEVRQIGKPNPNAQRFFGGSGGLFCSPDGKLLAALSVEVENMQAVSLLRFWDLETGNEVRQIKGPPNSFSSVLAFAAEGKGLAWSGADSTIRIYDVQTGKEMRQIAQGQQRGANSALIFSPDGKVLAARSFQGISLIDFDSGKELRVLGGQAANPGNVFVRGVASAPPTIAFAPDGKTLAEAAAGNLIRLWEVDTGKEIVPVSGHQGGVGALSVSPDGKTVTTRGADDTIRQWDLHTGKELHRFKLPAGLGAVTLSADGRILAAGTGNNTVQLIDTATGKEIRSVPVPAAQQPQFGRGVTGSGGLTLSADGKFLAVRGGDGTLRLFEVASGKEVHSITEQQPNPANPNGAVFIASSVSAGRSPSLVFSPDGTTLATFSSMNRGTEARPGVFVPNTGLGGGSLVRLWSVARGKALRQFEIKDRSVVQTAFTPDAAILVTANADSTISLWEIASGRECLHFPVRAGQPQPQPNPQPAQAIRTAPAAPQSLVTSLAVSPDGRTLAASCADQKIRLWDLRTGTALGEFAGHQGSVLDVCFAPDGTTLISGSADTTALVWDGARFIKKDAPAAVELTPEQLESLWADLTGDAGKAYKAILTLSTAPKQAVTLLGQRVKAEPGVPQQQLDQLIKDLDSEKFDVRQKANDELEKLGELAQPALTKVILSQPALETRQRVERILERISTGKEPPADTLRALRAVHVLRQLATPEAKQVLQALAQGAPGAKLTRLAEEAVNRLK